MGEAIISRRGGGEYGTAGPEHVLTGYTLGTENGVVSGTMPNRAGDTAALSISRSGTTLKLRAPKGFYDGTDDNVTYNEPNWIAANIPVGISMFGLTGSNTNKKWASGAIHYSAGNLVLTGLTFRPSLVVIYVHSSVSPKGCYYAVLKDDGTLSFMGKHNQYAVFFWQNSNGAIYSGSEGVNYITNDGFNIASSDSYKGLDQYPNYTFNYFAVS